LILTGDADVMTPAGRSQRGVLPDPVDEAHVRPGRC
jgi:hypothetical protein